MFLTSTIGCVSNTKKILGTDINKKVFDLSFQNKDKSNRSFSELHKESKSLNQYIGSYPPRFKNEMQRQQIYEHWLDLVADAEAYSVGSSDKEKSHYILAELYRQGHNMDVKGSAERAKKNLDSCFMSLPKSIPCNLSASYFYLSIGPKYLESAEKSLSILREHFHPKLNPEVEGGYVFLYLYQRDVDKTRSQIDKYIENFPNTRRAKDFSVIRANLGNKIGVKQY